MARVYRNISIPIVIFGLELGDIVILLGLFFILFNISNSILLNGCILFFVYLVLRWAKRGKPPGYILQLIHFIISQERSHVSLNDSLPRVPSRNESNKNTKSH